MVVGNKRTHAGDMLEHPTTTFLVPRSTMVVVIEFAHTCNVDQSICFATFDLKNGIIPLAARGAEEYFATYLE